MDLQKRCDNCSNSFTGKYCNQCGQKEFLRSDFSIKNFFGHLLDEVFDLDSKILKTVKRLVFSPGKLTKDYLEGRQIEYISPVKLYLIIITVNFIVCSFFDHLSFINVKYLLTFNTNEFIGAIINKGLEGITIEEFDKRVNDTLVISLYFVIFVFAAVLKLFYIRSEKFYVEHLIYCLHFMAFGFLRDTLFLPLNLYNRNLATLLTIVSNIIYFFFALNVVYGDEGIKRIVNSFLLYAIFLLIFTSTIAFSILLNVIF